MSDKIIEKIVNLEEKITRLEKKIDMLIDTCSHMDNHINFVENTYDKFKTPLNFVADKVNHLIGNTDKGRICLIDKKDSIE